MTKINHLMHGDRLRVVGVPDIPDDAIRVVYATVTGRFYIVGEGGTKHYLDEHLADDGETLAGCTLVRL